MNNIAHIGWSRSAEPEDSWKNSVRMVYQVVIGIKKATGTDYIRLEVNNFHNAEAIQAALQDTPCLEVTIIPDAFAYLTLLKARRA